MGDVVIVGAGPVGLLNAIGLLTKRPGLNVTLLEKYPSYTRHHVVQLDYHCIQAYIDACKPFPADPTLTLLLKRVKDNKFIRTSEIETMLRTRAIELGAVIKTGMEVKDVDNDVVAAYPTAQLIIGADGTHSLVSKSISSDNQQKFPFDFVMQLRYEVEGDAEHLGLPNLVQLMQSYGITCDEYVGKKGENGRTPITFQLMITKQQFDFLYPLATSKDPIKPFKRGSTNFNVLPAELLHRIQGYLGVRLSAFTAAHQQVYLSEAKISVNEAPATRAKQVYYQREDRREVVLIGDAAMGLSYFKGLNAGIESSAKLLSTLTGDEQQSSQLTAYNDWFDKVYAPKKIKEVAHFSTFNIRLIVKIFKFLQFLLGKHFFINSDEAERTTALYQGHEAQLNTAEPTAWTPYPHRVNSHLQVFTYMPNAAYLLKKTGKFVRDSVNPYKARYQLWRDLLTPLIGLKQLIVALIELPAAILIAIVSIVVNLISTPKEKRWKAIKSHLLTPLYQILESGVRLVQSIIMLLSIPFIPLRLLVRGIITWLNPQSIEGNPGIKRLLMKIDTTSAPPAIEQQHAICIDIHRKFQKAHKHAQVSTISAREEESFFQQCDPNQPEHYDAYLNLFRS